MRLTLTILLASAWLWISSAVLAQDPQPTASAPAAELVEELLPGGAVLKTDADQQRLLERAEQYAAENRPDLAATLYQKLLDEAGQTLAIEKLTEPTSPTSSPLVLYRPLSEKIDRSLQAQPPVVLEAYRTLADAEARAVLAAGGEYDEQTLTKVVRRFLLSSLGEDAALRLASLALDQHDYGRALSILKKAVELHPETAPLSAPLQSRLAVAAAGAHDGATAEQALIDLKASTDRDSSPDLYKLVSTAVAQLKNASTAAIPGPTRDWPMPFGNPARSGRMLALAASATAGDLAELHSVQWPLPVPGLGSSGQLLRPGDAVAVNSSQPPTQLAQAGEIRADLIARWRANGWRPAGQPLFSGNQIYFKTADGTVCYNRTPQPTPLWQSAWQNRYELDAMTRRLALVSSEFGNSVPHTTANRPSSPVEILLFGDRVHQSLSMARGEIFSIEGKRASAVARPRQASPAPWAATPRRTRSNWLTAYEATGGRAEWSRNPAVGDQPGEAEIGFLAAPTPCGDELIAPVTDGGEIWLYGLDAKTGATLWSLYLCDEPLGGAPPWSEIVMAVNARDVFLTCGCGVALAIDTASRSIRWAVRYRRDGKVNSVLKSIVGEAGSILDFGGWDDDVAISVDGIVVVMPSDSDRLLALDQRTGERVWESPRTSPLGSIVNYGLGVHGRSLYVAGKNAIRRYDLQTGRLLIEREIGESFGRGCLTEDAIYLPVGESVLKFDLELTIPPSKSIVAISTKEPLGSLCSDGEQLWVVGAGRVYNLTRLEDRLTELAARIATGDADALLDRMRLYLKQGRLEPAVADLRTAVERLQSQRTFEKATERLFDVLAEQSLPEEHPLVVLSLLTDMLGPSSPNRTLVSPQRQRLADTLATCIASLRQRSTPQAVPVLLAAAPLFKEEYLITAATYTSESLSKRDDLPALIAGLDRGPAEAQLMSIRPAVRLAPETARAPLQKLLSSNDDRVRLASARALVNLGERQDILPTLVALLESQSVAVRSRSHQTLQALTRQRIPFAAEGAAADRVASIQAWRRWVQMQGPTATWSVPLRDKSVALGRILIVGPGTLIELDADRRERWRGNLAGAGWGCHGLPNGHRLVAIHSHASVVEFDANGREVWKKDRLPGPPTSVERLENGNTLVACSNTQQLVEIAPDGAVSRISVPGNPIWAQRLESGNTLVALQSPIQRVVEIDASSRVVWEARTAGDQPWHAVRLENGNTLVTLSQARKVIEFDPTGKTIVWTSQATLLQPLAAQRLASGNTLIADQTGLRELDPTGKTTIWQLRLPGVTGLSCF